MVQAFIGEDWFADVTETDFLITEREREVKTMEIYMRRRNKIYFRDPKEHRTRLIVESDKIPDEVTELKYGTIVTCKFDVY